MLTGRQFVTVDQFHAYEQMRYFWAFLLHLELRTKKNRHFVDETIETFARKYCKLQRSIMNNVGPQRVSRIT